MTLHAEIQSLKELQCDDRCVLSVYLNTNPTDLNAQNGAWKIHLKNGLKRVEEYLTASNNEEELKIYKKLRKKVEKEIMDHQNELQKGVVIFASPHEDLWSVHHVQIPVKTSFHWEKHPVVEELTYMYKAYPKSGIVMTSHDQIRILDTEMGKLKDELHFEFDPGLDTWTEQKGVRSSGRIQGRSGVGTPGGSGAGSVGGGAAGGNSPVIGGSGGGSPVDELEDRMRENLERFYKEMGAKVEKLKSERNWEQLHVVGEAELVTSFNKTLRKKPTSSIHKNLKNSDLNKIFSEVFEK
ncbi:MAG TPA: VLRF1 family aeRF1-type release factor [Planococcus sp. (in: firmicutes)]|nr:VLRF1 family aeRF1-type release factor [Planococcus sp. (in: firmicutes)]